MCRIPTSSSLRNKKLPIVSFIVFAPPRLDMQISYLGNCPLTPRQDDGQAGSANDINILLHGFTPPSNRSVLHHRTALLWTAHSRRKRIPSCLQIQSRRTIPATSVLHVRKRRLPRRVSKSLWQCCRQSKRLCGSFSSSQRALHRDRSVQ